MFLEVPQIQFMIKVLDIPVVCSDGYAVQNCAEHGRLHSAVLGQVCHDWCWGWSRQCSFRGGAAVAVFLTVVDIPFFFRRGSTHSVKQRRRPGNPLCSSWWLFTRPTLCNDRCPWSLFSAYIAEEAVVAHVVDNGGMFMDGLAGGDAFRAVFPFDRRQLPLFRHLGRYGLKNSFQLRHGFWTSPACAETSGRSPRWPTVVGCRGLGGAGVARSFTPRRLGTLIRCMRGAIDTDIAVTSRHLLPHTHFPPPPPQSVPLRVTICVALSSVRVALAEALHSSGPSTKKVVERREGREEVERETYNLPRHQKTPPPGARPASLAEPPGPQARVQRHTVEQIFDTFVPVPILEDPVPQMVDRVVIVIKNFDISSPVEQVIDVPKILCPARPSRAVLRVPQLVEQLVDVLLSSFDSCALATRQEKFFAVARDAEGEHRQPRAVQNPCDHAPEFQQSFQFLSPPQIQFVDRVLDIPGVCRDVISTFPFFQQSLFSTVCC